MQLPDRPRILALGGAGGMGRVAVRVAAGWAEPAEIVVADLDRARAEEVVASLAAESRAPLRAAAADVLDPESIGPLLREADVVLNTTGPFYRLGVPVLRASIEAGCHYLDICDDWEPTLEMLELHQLACDRGVLALVGIGASPGASNLLARLACEHLDEVDDLFTAWPVDVPLDGEQVVDAGLDSELGPSAAVIHWMQQISGSIRVVEGGALVERPPLAAVAVDYPGQGRGTGYTVGHPEPITLRERMGVAGRSANLMILKKTTAAYLDLLRRDIDAGRRSLEEAAGEVIDQRPLRSARAWVRARALAGPGELPPFFALARGRRDGLERAVGARVLALPPGMDGATGVPLALGLRQLLDGGLDAVGVHPPESVLQPRAFFESLAPHCAPPRAGFDALVEISEAPA